MHNAAEPGGPLDAQLTTPTTGLTVHYRDWGGTGRPILLLHGLASSAQIWDFVAPALRGRGHALAIDQRGHGATGKPDDGYAYATIVADLAGVVQALGLAPPIVVGHSWGASVALSYAAQTPACPGAVLIDGGIVDMQARPGATWDDTAARLAPPDLTHLRLDDLVGYMGQGPLGHLDAAFRRRFFHSLMEEQPDGTVRPRLSRARHMAILRAMWDERPGLLLAQVTCPLLVVVAEPPGVDAADPWQVTRRQSLARLGDHAHIEVERMPDTIHDIPLQRPASLAARISTWMDAHGL